jgi:hypothetical protein
LKRVNHLEQVGVPRLHTEYHGLHAERRDQKHEYRERIQKHPHGRQRPLASFNLIGGIHHKQKVEQHADSDE